MGQGNPDQSSGRKLRHYIIMITVVVLGIFTLLLVNTKSSGNSLTSAVIENVRNNSLIDSITDLGESDTINPMPVEKTAAGSNSIEFLLSSSAIPTISQAIRAESLQLTFTDLSAAITVNEDKLELNGLSQVILGIYGFAGQITLDDEEITLEGIAKSFEVNGISLASSKQIKISFKGLVYQQTKLAGAEFKDVDFVTGDGSISIGNRLTYGLESGQVATIHNFAGAIDITKSQLSADINSTLEETNLRMEGLARGLDVVNGALNINLR